MHTNEHYLLVINNNIIFYNGKKRLPSTRQPILSAQIRMRQWSTLFVFVFLSAVFLSYFFVVILLSMNYPLLGNYWQKETFVWNPWKYLRINLTMMKYHMCLVVIAWGNIGVLSDCCMTNWTYHDIDNVASCYLPVAYHLTISKDDALEACKNRSAGIRNVVVINNVFVFWFAWIPFKINRLFLSRSPDAHLASIHSVEENKFIWELLNSTVNMSTFQSSWLDGTGAGRLNYTSWRYSDGTPFNYMNWGHDQPDDQSNEEHCLTMVGIARVGSFGDGVGRLNYVFCRLRIAYNIIQPLNTGQTLGRPARRHT
jgi:hypothetical protein